MEKYIVKTSGCRGERDWSVVPEQMYPLSHFLSLIVDHTQPFAFDLLAIAQVGVTFDTSLAISGVLLSRGSERLISVSNEYDLKGIHFFFSSHPHFSLFLSSFLLFFRCRSFL